MALEKCRRWRPNPVAVESGVGSIDFSQALNTRVRKSNRLLDALPADVLVRLQPKCETLALINGRVLHKAGEVIRDLYFPIDCMISITVTMRSGKTAETGVIGNREVAGINAFMGGRETTQTEYETQIPAPRSVCRRMS